VLAAAIGDLALQHLLGHRQQLHAGHVASIGAPSPKFVSGTSIGPAGVLVAGVGREEVEKAHRGASGGGERRNDTSL
jgi:hypothetical protein